MSTTAEETARLARWCRRSAAAGALLYLILFLLPLPTDIVNAVIQRLLLAGPLIAVPLGLSMVADARAWPCKAAVWLQLPFAVGGVASLYVPQGAVGVGLAVPWAVETALIALFGLWRLRERGLDLRRPEELCIDAGLAYLSIGGAWWLIARSGVHTDLFEPLIVQLTPPHFHFAGFAAPLIAGLVGRLIPTDRPRARRAYALAALSVIAGPPLIALGITLSPLVEVICALILASGLLLLSGLMLFVVLPSLKNPFAWVLMIISSLSLVLTMVLACLYAIGEFNEEVWLLIPTMAQTHGVANVFGFSLCGLLALALSRRDSAPP